MKSNWITRWAGILSLAILASLPNASPGREWTSTDGRKLEADFVSATEANVTLKRSADGKEFTIPLNGLSSDDQAWIKAEAAKPPPADVPKPIEGVFADQITGDWVLAEHDGLPYAIYGAKELDGSKQYPLVLALHGKSDNNENGLQVGGWMKTFAEAENYAKNPCILVAPLCYQPHGGTGGGWNAEPGDKAIKLVEELIDGLPIDEDRIYVFGYSMGGYGTTHLVEMEPRLFAAAVAVAGCTQSAAPTFRRVPLWLFHAADDAVVKVDGSRAMAEALKRAKDFKYTEYETGGHGIVGKVFADPAVHEWLFSHSR